MKKIIYFFAVASFFWTQSSEAQSVIMYTDSFINGTAATQNQINTWNAFRSNIDTSLCFTKMTISGTFDSAGKSTTDAAIIANFAKAIKANTTYISPSTNGNVWSICNRYVGEIWVNPPSSCSGSNCPNPGYIIRPGIGTFNPNWGGINTATCNGPNQRMTFTLEYLSKTEDLSICEGDSIMVRGVYRKTAGTYLDTIRTSGFCDTLVEINLAIDSLPNVVLQSFSTDTVCLNASPVNVPPGSPAGGVYSGTGVSGTSFVPMVAGIGTHTITYTFTDGNGCENSDETEITVKSCVGIDEVNLDENLKIYPNPNEGLFAIEIETKAVGSNFIIMDAAGKIVHGRTVLQSQRTEVDLQELPNGIYILEIQNDREIVRRKIMKN